MLMDEPFGAIDPINRERLQNQFLRLQSEISKTILFVTHDIDEAIKMGDRVAVLQKGGVLAQYATPAELLMSPANDFVEDFVGADRALKRLALLRVRDIDLWKAPLVRVGEPTAARGRRSPRPTSRTRWSSTSEGRPVGWLSERDLARETVPATPDTAPGPDHRARRRAARRAIRPAPVRHPVRPGGRRAWTRRRACCRSRSSPTS